MIELRLVERDEIALFWPHLEPLFARIPERVNTTVAPDNILSRARDRTLLLWAIVDNGKLLGAAATGIRDCGREKVAFVEAVAGTDMKRWLASVLEDFEARAKRAGATIIENEGRYGWERELGKLGYRPARIVMSKRL